MIMERQTESAHATAVYLRCYPRDGWAVMSLHRILDRYALDLGVSWPNAFIDNGISSHQAAPRRANLEVAGAAGCSGVILIPGPWVFALDDGAARPAVDRFTAQGCEVTELPRHLGAAAAPSAEPARTHDRQVRLTHPSAGLPSHPGGTPGGAVDRLPSAGLASWDTGP
jgi:hypothetical protein